MSISARNRGRIAAVVAAAAAIAVILPAAASAEPGRTPAADNGGSLGSSEGLNAGSVGLLFDSVPFIIDSLVQSGIPTDVEDLIYLGTNILNSTGSIAPTQPCSAVTKSGGAGITTTWHNMGRSGPASFLLQYETYDVPDRIEVLYDNQVIYDTGFIGDEINQGTGAAFVNVPAGTSTSVLVRVTGLDYTDWDYTVNCPS